MAVQPGGGAFAQLLLEWLYGRHGYGPVLVLVATSIVFALAAPEAGGSRAVLALLQGLTLLLALLSSDLPTPLLRPLTAPVAIAQGVFRRIRAERRVTVHLVLGVLAIYLLIGVTFAFADGAVDRLGARDFLRGQPDASVADFLYFSFATLTTTGYGDLVPGNDLARSFAILEALTGQIYLVTVVAVLVGNLARREG